MISNSKNSDKGKQALKGSNYQFACHILICHLCCLPSFSIWSHYESTPTFDIWAKIHHTFTMYNPWFKRLWVIWWNREIWNTSVNFWCKDYLGDSSRLWLQISNDFLLLQSENQILSLNLIDYNPEIYFHNFYESVYARFSRCRNAWVLKILLFYTLLIS